MSDDKRVIRDESGEKKISRMFTAARAIAILTVISAHTTIKTSEYIAGLYSAIGSIGVVVFFLISGYYFKRESPLVMIKKKLRMIIVPWVVIGSAVFVVNSLLAHSTIGITPYIEWMLGYKTYLYFVIVLIVCFVLFYYNNLITLITAVTLNAASVILTNAGILDPIVEKLHITNYINVFNWIGFFALGILLKRIDPDKLYRFIVKTRDISLGFSAVATILITFQGYKVGYFSELGWLYELVSAWSIFGLCTYKITHGKIMTDVSGSSYAIYLLHMMFVGILGKVYQLHFSISLFANIIVIVFVYLLIVVGRSVFYKINLGGVYDLLLGLRADKRKTDIRRLKKGIK